jgi:L-2-hydroxyglutarate oxidase LhgO
MLFELLLDDSTKLITKNLINCCGLNATNFAQKIEGFPKKFIRKTLFCKGTYFGYQGKLPFNHHIYPIPSGAGLGIHFTLDLNNNGQFGPDTEWVDTENYAVNYNRVKMAHNEIKKYWPKCNENKIRPVYSGIRPKIENKINFENDFLIQTSNSHKISGLINCYGIESPGLTSALSIAYNVVKYYL